MIPSILTDTGGGTSARNSKPTQEAGAETTQTFGDVFGSVEAEEAEAVLPVLGTADDSPELAFAMAEDPRALKPPISPNVSAADGPPLLPQDKQVTVVAGQDIEPDQPAATGTGLPSDPEVPTGPMEKLSAPRSSVAQSVVEGRLPVAPPAAQTAEVDVRKTVPDTGGKVELSKAAMTIAQPAPAQTGLAPIGMVEAQVATPVADKRAKAQPAEDGKTESRQAKASTAFMPLLGVGPSTQPLTATAVASFMQGGQAEIVTKSLDAEVSIGLGGIERGLSSAQSVTGTPATATTETARHVAHQIAVSVMNTPGKATEIALNPEELGRVRLSLTAADGVITLAVLAERPETQDLLRRHMDVLAQEFRALGYGTISFSFSHEGQSGDRADQDRHREETIAEPHEANTPAFRPHPGPVSGLDLRI